MSDQIPIGDPKEWTDDEWLQALSVPAEELDRARAIAVVAAWNRVRKQSVGSRFTVADMMAPDALEIGAIEALVRRSRHEAGNLQDVLVVTVPPGMGRAVTAAIARSLGDAP